MSYCLFLYMYVYSGVQHFVLSNVFTLSVPCCHVRYDFRIKTMFGSPLPPVFCRRAHVLFTLFVLIAHSGVQHILCCGFRFVSLRLVSCVPSVTSFSGLSIFSCPFGFLWRLFTQYYFGIYVYQMLIL